ncbi:MAG: hypothetical protein QOJ38_885 [Solirubrobacterales bacterium]|jgi:hypothetical protein|nr:hypothetical protein [Solirubrobacterales bacterium]
MASRKEQKERLKAERLEAEAQTKSADRRKRLVGLGIAAVLGLALVAVIAVVALSGGSGSSSGCAHIVNVGGATTTGRAKPDDRCGTKTTAGALVTNLDEAAKAAHCQVVHPKDEGNTHLTPKQPTPHYKTNPPTSGSHDPIPGADGGYATTPPFRNFVHSLEHGRVEIQYSSKLPAADQLKLKGVFDESFQDMMIFPNNTMRYQVAVAAWDHYLGCPRYSDQVLDAVRAFRETYRDQGPESPASQPG